jgi:membrane-bound ClpP family serine protease
MNFRDLFATALYQPTAEAVERKMEGYITELMKNTGRNREIVLMAIHTASVKIGEVAIRPSIEDIITAAQDILLKENDGPEIDYDDYKSFPEADEME